MKITRSKLRQIIREQITVTSSPDVKAVNNKTNRRREELLKSAVKFADDMVSSMDDASEKKIITSMILAVYSIVSAIEAGGQDARIAEEWYQGTKASLDAGLRLARELKEKKAPPTDDA